jgi:serine protease AprX
MKTAYKTFPTSSTAVDPVTGQSFVSQYDIFTVGAGYLDIAAALANKDIATGTAMSPTARYDASSGNVYLVFNPSSTWNDSDAYAGTVSGTKSAWGAQTVWGTTVVDANSAVWGSSAVWASSTVSGFSAVWGSSGVWASEGFWSSSTSSATSAVWGSSVSTTDSNTNFTVH